MRNVGFTARMSFERTGSAGTIFHRLRPRAACASEFSFVCASRLKERGILLRTATNNLLPMTIGRVSDWENFSFTCCRYCCTPPAAYSTGVIDVESRARLRLLSTFVLHNHSPTPYRRRALFFSGLLRMLSERRSNPEPLLWASAAPVASAAHLHAPAPLSR